MIHTSVQPARTSAAVLPGEAAPVRRGGAEWWWFTARVRTGAGPVGLVAAFLRHRAAGPEPGLADSHAVLWARSGPAEDHRVEAWMDRGCLDLLRAAAAADPGTDPRVRTALAETLLREGDLHPDRVLPAPVRTGGDRLDLDFGVARLRAQGAGHVVEADGENGFSLLLTPGKPALSRSRPGAGRWSPADAAGTRVHTVPRLEARGVVRDRGREEPVAGDGWYEHIDAEPWHRADRSAPADAPAWSWAGLRLDDGWELEVHRTGPDGAAGATVVAVSPEGEPVAAPARVLTRDPWTSLSSLNTYPTAWEVQAPDLGLSLSVRSWFPRQEIRSLVLGPGMLCAHVDAEGALAGRRVRGHGVWEEFPDNRIGDFERYVTRIRDTTLEEIDRLYPALPRDTPLSAAGCEDRPERFYPGSADDLHASLIEPMRHATEGLGKSWRSYVAVAAIELCGGDVEPYRPLLAATELLHTGCLVVDDVQDGSPLRRGRPAAHTVFGAPAAINAGTAAYFAFDRVFDEVLPDDDALRLRVYRTYLWALRAGHAGQALDIAGHRPAMDRAVATGDAGPLLERIRTVHRLKTAAPVRGVAEIGARIAGADDALVRALGDYFEAVGLAYQISDDVMDLRGVTAPSSSGASERTKHTAEDLRAGKATMPLAHAVALLPPERVRRIWETVRDGCEDRGAIASAVGELEGCGAVAACEEEAAHLVSAAWEPLRDLLPASWTAVHIRALGAYAAHREPE
ncbi:Geranylgeranyl pyrophosphate synthase [Nocardiopsis flavescens]|uniref:Geranylgeranyl pyrophosphate synthase n=1 Tax=Nocardiopsis flavescens TaxID=758803 RepID=A0A1M6CAQ9_9ACTN|nr:polyprenyl synthetase family protein [Nocardiopsis flavescens]SHI58112.1 Geranylgeranyl pyrophosphate synthase [Nocardiopsis flavescens]